MLNAQGGGFGTWDAMPGKTRRDVEFWGWMIWCDNKKLANKGPHWSYTFEVVEVLNRGENATCWRHCNFGLLSQFRLKTWQRVNSCHAITSPHSPHLSAATPYLPCSSTFPFFTVSSFLFYLKIIFLVLVYAFFFIFF